MININRSKALIFTVLRTKYLGMFALFKMHMVIVIWVRTVRIHLNPMDTSLECNFTFLHTPSKIVHFVFYYIVVILILCYILTLFFCYSTEIHAVLSNRKCEDGSSCINDAKDAAHYMSQCQSQGDKCGDSMEKYNIDNVYCKYH